ncbi:sodium-dependent transporter [Natronincola ferrireducens]|uniref:Transporter n=1 Tax=Natronincola ferrireducens TaxID=393762 RepID=A0A1G8Z9E5_9FIRM|nr:sodium-dependent transporter [Natronincola ferrireducens]SDK11637.1 neurotransmitter:Na+ symporter, NSS family [Natronincola ferrireducens]
MKRDNFGSKLGVLAAAAGSAIGLGNIWKFPYVAGQNGGAAFILVYLLCVAIVGIPVMVSEFALGRKTQANAAGVFKKLKPNSKWSITGYLGIFTAFIILSYYAVIAGWIFAYIARSATGKLANIAPDQIGVYFESIIGSNIEPVFWSLFVIVLTGFIVMSGIKEGIEKYSKILMPILLGILVVLMFRSLTLEGASKGLEFLFKPDFSQLTTKGVLEALGHSFFSLSLGMAIIITYGSYVKKDENIASLSLQVILVDTLIAIMAGIVIFPAVFAYGFEPQAGPTLIFITLPAVFQEMPFGALFETLFFMLIGIAAITSTISLLEVSVAFVTEEFKLSRKKTTVILSSILFLLSIPSALSFGALSGVTVFGKTFFDLFDFITSNIFLPLGGLLVCLFAAWVWGAKNVAKEVTSNGIFEFKWEKLYSFTLKYIAPIAILLIFLYSIGIVKLN